MSSTDPEEAWRRFYQEYGRAMVAWQVLESELATLFSLLTKIPPAMAIQIYYSSHSFNGRMQVYKGGLTASSVKPDVKSVARKVTEKAKNYAEYRNKFAHDVPLLRQVGPGSSGSPAEFDIVLVHGKGQFQADDVKMRYVNEGVTVDEITYSAGCFRQLSDLVRHFWVQHRREVQPGQQDAWLDTLRERLHALPNLPRKEALSQPSAVPKSPPAPSGE